MVSIHIIKTKISSLKSFLYLYILFSNIILVVLSVEFFKARFYGDTILGTKHVRKFQNTNILYVYDYSTILKHMLLFRLKYKIVNVFMTDYNSFIKRLIFKKKKCFKLVFIIFCLHCFMLISDIINFWIHLMTRQHYFGKCQN